jgi:hypothetical protein
MTTRQNAVAQEAMYAEMAAMDNQDEPLENYSDRLVGALYRAGFVITPVVLPTDALGEAAVSGVADTGNPKHVWDFLIPRVMAKPLPSDAVICKNEKTESDDALMLRVAREEIKRQAAEIERLQHWQRAVDDACTVSWVIVTDDARETVKALIARECQIALDPLVSSDAQALIDRGREEANKGGGMLQKQKSSKLREITKADVSRAERWLNEAPRELKRNEYHKVKMLCKQVIRVLRRKETESACNNTEARSLNAEIERLKTRLEVSAYHPYDGIVSRDATIKLQDERIAELQADAARYRYIRTHRIGIKWCELYAGGPLLDGVIDSMMTEAGPSPINSAALHAAAQKE